MGNYCSGTLYCTGDKQKLNQFLSLLENLYELSATTGFDGDSEWMGHVLTEEVMPEGLFYEGGGWEGDTLEVYMRVSRSDGSESIQGLADATNSNIKWAYVDDSDEREHSLSAKPTGKTGWTLRPCEGEAGPDCQGSITVSGDSNVIEALKKALDSMGLCAESSGFNFPPDWLPHIFTEQVTDLGIYYEGNVLMNGALEVYIRTQGTDGTDFFESMANQLGVCVLWIYSKNVDRQERRYNSFGLTRIGKWSIRSSEGLSGKNAQVSNKRPVTCQEIEVQLDMASALSGVLRSGRVLDYDKLTMLKANIIQHIYLASTMFRDLVMASYGNSGPSYPGWDTLLRHIDRFASVFPADTDEVRAVNPELYEARMQLQYIMGACDMYGCLRSLYVCEFPRQRSYVYTLNISFE